MMTTNTLPSFRVSILSTPVFRGWIKGFPFISTLSVQPREFNARKVISYKKCSDMNEIATAEWKMN